MKEIELLKMKYDINDDYINEIHIPKLIIKDGITLIVGSSGSGKTTILKSLGLNKENISIDYNKSVIENFSSIGQGEKLLISFGLRSIPTWFNTPNKISNGEFHRFVCAICIDKGINIIDEFTSVVDRNTAKSLAVAIRKSVDKGIIKRVIIASCHRDILEWLQPDITYDTDTLKTINRGQLRQRPPINICITAGKYEDWFRFKKHHYLDGNVSKSCHYYIAKFNDEPIGFVAVIHGTGRDIRTYWRESRIVVLPEFQGLGIGYKLSVAIAEEYIKSGRRYFAKTAHPALGKKRNESTSWRNTSTNMKGRPSYLNKNGVVRNQSGYGKTKMSAIRDSKRVCYSHEYIGGAI
jgi:ABC-type lipoprotein export system ATPase subunit/GNAT superfamily N-acetyltransferase